MEKKNKIKFKNVPNDIKELKIVLEEVRKEKDIFNSSFEINTLKIILYIFFNIDEDEKENIYIMDVAVSEIFEKNFLREDELFDLLSSLDLFWSFRDSDMKPMENDRFEKEVNEYIEKNRTVRDFFSNR